MRRIQWFHFLGPFHSRVNASFANRITCPRIRIMHWKTWCIWTDLNRKSCLPLPFALNGIGNSPLSSPLCLCISVQQYKHDFGDIGFLSCVQSPWLFGHLAKVEISEKSTAYHSVLRRHGGLSEFLWLNLATDTLQYIGKLTEYLWARPIDSELGIAHFKSSLCACYGIWILQRTNIGHASKQGVPSKERRRDTART